MSQNPYAGYAMPNVVQVPPTANQTPFSSLQGVNGSILQQPFASTSNSSTATAAAPTPTAFKAPAHKHAHHLHSIPPREKSTRTLIIDHMLWVHGRTRFAQARAELGMTDRTGGISFANYRHRERPELFEEDEELPSEGEDASALNAQGGPDDTHNDAEDYRTQNQDLSLARSLRLRAEGLEKVVTSMLDQPPEVHPMIDNEPLTPPTSPKHPAERLLSHPHTLPNGVRLRLALGTVINDLFARQAPPPPYRHHHHPPPIVVSQSGSDIMASQSGAMTPASSPVIQKTSTATSSVVGSGSSSGEIRHTTLPPSLVLLSTISAAGYSKPSFSLRNGFQQTSSSASPMPSPTHMNPMTQSRSRRGLSSRVRGLYMEGADPSTANSPPGLRCPRHLHTGCEICVEAKQQVKIPAGPSRTRTASSTGTSSHGNNTPQALGNSNGQRSQAAGSKSTSTNGGGISGYQDGSGIGSGLARPGISGSILRRKSQALMTPSDGDLSSNTGAGAGNTRLSELIPRFIRLSALVALELGQELREDYHESDREWQGGGDAGGGPSDQRTRSWESDDDPREGEEHFRPALTPASSSPSAPTRQSIRAQNDSYVTALRPSREWYMLLAGLLTRAILEGYLTGGWRGTDAVECLLAVGLGTDEDDGKDRDVDAAQAETQSQVDDDENDEFDWFDPDDLPSLTEAARIMFPALRKTRREGKDSAEAEYEAEMQERLRRFYAIPSLTPDLSTHMEDLAWHYPAEPIERAALRFCEAIAKWRGKPELETYKKKQPFTRSKPTAASTTSNMTIDSLVHSNPNSPSMPNRVASNGSGLEGSRSGVKLQLPSIERYFVPPPQYSSWSRNKRARPSEDDRANKRLHS